MLSLRTNKRTLLLIAAILLILVLTSTWAFMFLGREEVVSESNYTCNSDSDCVSVASGCCGCSAMGKSKAINSDQKDEYLSDLEERCQVIACPQEFSDDPTCFAEAKCRDGYCKLVK